MSIVTPPANQTWKKYYYLGGRRIALRIVRNGQADEVNYLHGDHLGSTSLTMSNTGAVVSSSKYYPYGADRAGGTGTPPTDYRFTGQRQDANIGLYDYGARFYDPLLGRFISADTIVPNPSNPQSFNRYAYINNNPLKYIDPSGHDMIWVGGQGLDNWSSSGQDPYDDPIAIEKWVREYTGWTYEEFMKWRNKWKAGSDQDKMTLAQLTGVAVFKWDDVPGQEQALGNAAQAAVYLQIQINRWGLKDVTVIGHSKGGVVVSTLMSFYQEGWINRGAVKNMVMIDPPQDPIAWLEGGTTATDAKRQE